MLQLYGVQKIVLGEDAREVKKNARVSYTVAIVVSFFVKVSDVTERTMGMLNIYRWFKEDNQCSVESLPEPIRKKLAEFI